MSEQEELMVSEEVENQQLLDTDFHLHLPTEELLPYIDDETTREQIEDHGAPPFRGSTLNAGYGKEVWPEEGESWQRPQGVAYTSEEISKVKEQFALNEIIISPPTTLPLVRTIYPRVTNKLVKAYNDFVVDNVIDIDEGIYATLVFPHWDVEAGLDELDRLGSEEGFVAAQNWINTPEPWGHPEYDPLYEKLLSLDLPLFLHITSMDNAMTPNILTESHRTHTEKTLLTCSYAVTSNVINMVMTGVFDKYPELDVVMQEAGANWIPYVSWRADELYQTWPNDLELMERFEDRGKEYLDKMPSEYIFNNIFVTTQPTSLPNVKPRSDVTKLLDVCKAEKMFLYSSDWPHSTTDPANWLFDLSLDDELRESIAHESAEEIVRLPD